MTVVDQQKIMVVCAERERAGRTVGEQEIYGEVRERTLFLLVVDRFTLSQPFSFGGFQRHLDLENLGRAV